MVSVMPHQVTIGTPVFSVSGCRSAPAPKRRYECSSGTSEARMARVDSPMSEAHVQPLRREISQKRLLDHLGRRTKRAPTQMLASTEDAIAFVWNSGM